MGDKESDDLERKARVNSSKGVVRRTPLVSDEEPATSQVLRSSITDNRIDLEHSWYSPLYLAPGLLGTPERFVL